VTGLPGETERVVQQASPLLDVAESPQDDSEPAGGNDLRPSSADFITIIAESDFRYRQVLTLYSLYYNETRTHLGLGKDAPLGRAVERSGTIVTTPILSGLHHKYTRI
jgi:hypothetical protein